MRNRYSSFAGLVLLVVVASLLVACDRGVYDTPVDTNRRYGFDTTPVNTVDSGAPPNSGGGSSVVANDSASDFIPPPHPEYVPNVTASDDERMRFVGKDAVKLWIWNRNGATKLFLAEGETAGNEALGITIEVNAIGGPDPRVYLILNGKVLPILKEREEYRSGDTYVFISDVLLNEAGE